MRICTKCKVEKDDSEFSPRKVSKSGFHSNCKECCRVYNNTAYKENRNGRAQKVREAATKRGTFNRSHVKEIKKGLVCQRCGDERHYVLDFHHLSDKQYTISDMVSGGYSLATIQKEIDKCMVLCANCHREIHYLETLKTNTI